MGFIFSRISLFRLELNTFKLFAYMINEYFLVELLQRYVTINMWRLQVTLYTSHFNCHKQKCNLQKWKQSPASLRLFPRGSSGVCWASFLSTHLVYITLKNKLCLIKLQLNGIMIICFSGRKMFCILKA